MVKNDICKPKLFNCVYIPKDNESDFDRIAFIKNGFLFVIENDGTEKTLDDCYSKIGNVKKIAKYKKAYLATSLKYQGLFVTNDYAYTSYLLDTYVSLTQSVSDFIVIDDYVYILSQNNIYKYRSNGSIHTKRTGSVDVPSIDAFDDQGIITDILKDLDPVYKGSDYIYPVNFYINDNDEIMVNNNDGTLLSLQYILTVVDNPKLPQE